MQSTLSELPGVTQVNVDFYNQEARCAIDPESFNQDEAIAKLDAAGYPAKVK